jgi:hypothetical protein
LKRSILNALFASVSVEPHPVLTTSIRVEDITRVSAAITWGQVLTGEFETYSVSILPPGPTVTPASIDSNETSLFSVISGLSPGVEYTVTIVTVVGDLQSEAADVKFRTSTLKRI